MGRRADAQGIRRKAMAVMVQSQVSGPHKGSRAQGTTAGVGDEDPDQGVAVSREDGDSRGHGALRGLLGHGGGHTDVSYPTPAGLDGFLVSNVGQRGNSRRRANGRGDDSDARLGNTSIHTGDAVQAGKQGTRGKDCDEL